MWVLSEELLCLFPLESHLCTSFFLQPISLTEELPPPPPLPDGVEQGPFGGGPWGGAGGRPGGMIASWDAGAGDHGTAGDHGAPFCAALPCAPKTAEKDAEFATGETWPEILQLSTLNLPLHEGKGNEQRLWG